MSFRIDENGSTPLLGKLQRKFILLVMAMVAALLAGAFVAICAINYQQDYTNVRLSLAHSLDRVVSADDLGEDADALTDEPLLSPSDAADAADALGNGNGNGNGRGFAGRRNAGNGNGSGAGRMTIGRDAKRAMAIGVYRLDGTTLTVMTNYATAELSSDQDLSEAAQVISSTVDGEGTIGGLSVYYERRTAASGTVYAAFASTAETAGWQSLAHRLLGVGLIVLAVTFVIALFFSRWALKPVKEAWVQQKRFIADASHDLKTPLTVILANSAILRDHPEKTVGEQGQWVESTENEARQMEGLVNDMLLLARLDEGVTARATEDVDFSELVEGEALEFESVAFEGGLELDSAVADGLRVKGDRSRLRRLVTTLLDNACKYTEKGGRVTVTCQKADGCSLRFAVTNSGAVISPEDLPHVFDRFYRTDESRTTAGESAGGHGLGLAIAHAIAEEHGGTLTAASDAINGTVFTATLPLA